VLLIGGWPVFEKRFLRMQAVSRGFPADHLLLMRLSLPKDTYANAASMRKFYDNLKRRVAVLPGVESVALGSVLPLSAMNVRSGILHLPAGRPPSPTDVPAAQNRLDQRRILSNHGNSNRRGPRVLTKHDTEASTGVAIVDQTLVKKYWLNRSPLGHTLSFRAKISKWSASPEMSSTTR